MQGNQFLGSRGEQAIKSQMRLCVARGGHARNTCLGVSGKAEAVGGVGTSWLRMTLSWEVSYFLICVCMCVESEVEVRCGCYSSDTVMGGTQRPSVHLSYSPPKFVVAILLFPHNYIYT